MLAHKLFEFTLIGGDWVLYILGLLSVAALGIVIDRLWYFRSQFGRANTLFRLQAAMKQTTDLGKIKKVLEQSEKIPGRWDQLLQDGLDGLKDGVTQARSRMEAFQVAEFQALEKNITFLGTVGNNAPFIGLFGTVLGIIKAFHDLSMDTAKGGQAVMAGISEALVATAVGLLVAIPAVATFNILKRRIKFYMSQGEQIAQLVVSLDGEKQDEG